VKSASRLAACRGILKWHRFLDRNSDDDPIASRKSARIFLAQNRNKFYVKFEKLWALLLPGRSLRVMMSEKPDWMEDIRAGFRRTGHTVEFGPITPESFQKYDVVVPLRLEDLPLVRDYAPASWKNPIPIPSRECEELCNDKFEFNRTLINAGFGKHIPRMGKGEELQPPYILKKRIGYWGSGCHIIRNHEDEVNFRELLNNPAYFCQEIVLGSCEFATHILFTDNEIVKALNIMYAFETEAPIKGKDSDIYKVVHRCPYLGLFARILQTIRFQGLCCVNYKISRGVPMVLEVNPRFGGSLSRYFFSFLRHLD
jgi:hypothetical protein